ncbi:tRNA 2-thiouridine(34) synthase MnmA [Alienimonas californiensis]|uniref:tRNA-specific 2-thiouridylase MnmA n=1 Tax=Alienimonas californiensis TaxID=2527989 RepID=A0A517PAF0_9PLAN|nr:tRNA 2-thiouridine(34) synthase MnmA [Alienimonas californiensis]QDT16349.1 tRNA-specific 2-thiouridylase MnmA [Alienimonas californiensis]
MPRIVLAMSGGVDSSAAAVLLKREGWEVVGLFMRSGAEAEVCATDSPLTVLPSAKAHKQGCCSASDAADARRVADRLDIPFHALNFAGEFGRIKDYFADEYLAGRTPNPCVQCNNWLKFGRLHEFARSVGAEAVASGHYARVETAADGRPALLRGVDRKKDQSYVLFGVSPTALAETRFPCGGLTKPEIRALAAEAGLRVADKPDSQEICFVPDNDYAGFVNRHRGHQETAGEFVDPAGAVIGEHPGYERFTVGQRKGLGIAFGEPRFVLRIEPDRRRVVLGSREDLRCDDLTAGGANWLVDRPTGPLRCFAQIRYQHRAAACEVQTDGDEFRVRFDEPQEGVAPGQACVLYDGSEPDRVLGGGWIRSGEPGA